MKKAYLLSVHKQLILYLVIVLAFCFIYSGCSSRTEYIKPTSLNNPPPKYAFSSYDTFIAEPIVISEEFRGTSS